jgi:serine/threonine protein kinase
VYRQETSVVRQQPLVEPLPRWDPEQVGNFVLIGRLGAGAMGQVYLGRSAAGRLVAVKTIKTELAEEPDFRNRFGQEVAAARRVSGAFTAAVVAADSEADVPWLATVYVPAPSLSRLVRTCGPVPVPAVRWLAAGCAEALESIHSVGLVHRDLKPANVLVSPDGPRVIDFGVARAAERIQLTVTRGSIGTPAYMAPEQARDTRQATSASDVFALGATMLFAATGHAPYQGETVMDVLVQLATGPPDLSGLPAELADVVSGCLERDPRNRPTSSSILARLAPALAAAGELSAPPLPAAALELIEEYRRIPRSSGRPSAAPGAAGDVPSPALAGVESGVAAHPDGNEAASGDDTIGSQPLGPNGPLTSDQAAGARHGRARSGPGQRGPAPRRTLRRRIALTGLTVAAAVALVGAGWVLRTQEPGAKAAASGSLAAPTTSSSPSTSGTSASAMSTTSATAPASGSDAALGPILPPPAGQSPPPGGLPAVSAPIVDPTPGVPFVALSQPTGDGRTGFVVHGGYWPPGAQLTISLAGVGSSPDHPVTDSDGNFNYTINQAHEFFAGEIPAGTYTVQVTGPHGLRASARFRVLAG